jgi:hypothetical protein
MTSARSDQPNVGEVLSVNARLFPDEAGARDLERRLERRLQELDATVRRPPGS